MDNTDKLRARIDELVGDYQCVYVKQDAAELDKLKHTDWKLKWMFIIKGHSFDYTQGLGHLPGWKSGVRWSIAHHESTIHAISRGVVYKFSDNLPSSHTVISITGIPIPIRAWHFSNAKIPAPDILDLMFCLLMDAEANDYTHYEDWADTFGLERDSRAGEAMYNACLLTARKLNYMFTPSVIQELRTMYQEAEY